MASVTSSSLRRRASWNTSGSFSAVAGRGWSCFVRWVLMNSALVNFINTHHTSGQQLQPRAADPLPDLFSLAPRLGEERVADAIAAYEAGTSARQIAGPLGISRTGLLELLRSQGVEVRQRRTLTSEEIEVGARLYEGGSILREIAGRFDVSTEQVRTALLRRGVTMRPGRGAVRGFESGALPQ